MQQISQAPTKPTTNGRVACNKSLREKFGEDEREMPLKSDSYEWSRLGPMGFLLEPKLYPVNTNIDLCAGKSMKCNDAKIWMNTVGESANLQEPTMPGYDTLRIIHEDRLKSTYQIDYDHLVEYPYIEYDKIQLERKPSEIKCRVPVKLPSIGGHRIPGRPGITTFPPPPDNLPTKKNLGTRKKITPREAPESKVNQDSKARGKITKMPEGLSKPQRKGHPKPSGKVSGKSPGKFVQTTTGNALNTQIPPWTTEYWDVICFTADEIMKNRLLCTTKKCKEGK
ncbi:uncharacterized protein [Fopius arisanus]|uniref:Uncharacterized protein isoform X2 n=1 Tax=Fopius arisanus TaxID=64838 RepID=A0A9R1UA15_9HYME|nr:PREDICTED: uncharacterized protein LOC105272518 isoform X2 [Fopius arisanus]